MFRETQKHRAHLIDAVVRLYNQNVRAYTHKNVATIVAATAAAAADNDDDDDYNRTDRRIL